MIVTVLLENEEELSAFQSYHVPEHYFRPSLFLGHLAKTQKGHSLPLRSSSDVFGCCWLYRYIQGVFGPSRVKS